MKFSFIFYLSKNINETTSNTKETPDEIDLIKFKLFHFTSILVLSTFASSKEIESKLVLSNNSFKGILPTTVTPKAPIQYVNRININIQKTLFGYQLK